MVGRQSRSSWSPPRTSPTRTASGSTAASSAFSRRARPRARPCCVRCAISSRRVWPADDDPSESESRAHLEPRAGPRASVTVDRATLAHLRHELRTPLNHIIGYGEMLLEDGGRPELESGLRLILDDAAVLVDLVNQVLAPAIVEAGAVDLARLPAELGPPLDRILGTCQATRVQQGAADVDEVESDLERIRQAALHLRDLVHGGLAPRVAERAEAMPLPNLPAMPS